jgi:PEP-CTERM motif
MMITLRTFFCGVVFASACLMAQTASATLINFEDQPAGPAVFASAGPAQTLVYTAGPVTATFTGGVILTDETSESTDFTNVYATASFGDSTLTNPLVVTFNEPIQNFQIDILNALAGNYELSDNAGHSDMFSLATTGGSAQTVGFAATGTVVDITFLGPPSGNTTFDFAIDNVTFNQPLSGGTPEPSTWVMMVLGFAGLGFAGYRASRKGVAFAA